MDKAHKEKLYPSWLSFNEPIQTEDGRWLCPYCKNTFTTNEKAYPKLVMTFESYQNLIREHKDLQSVLEAHRYFLDGHPCHPFTHYFWKRYEQLKRKFEKETIEFLERSRYREIYTIEHPRWYKNSKKEGRFHTLLFKLQNTSSNKKVKIAIGILLLIIILLGLMFLIIF